MSYKDKPQIKLYKFEENKLKLKAIVDDFEEVSMNHNKYEAGEFSIQINFNIPNSQLFDKNMFVQIGNNPEDIFVITKINDEIGEDGKQSQRRTITGYDCRYLFKRRFIINLNNGSTWNMSGSAEDVMLSLISDQCGNNAETKRKLPINVEASRHLGNDFTVSEAYSNLYETLVTIATQSELGWNVTIDNNEFKLKFYVGEDKHNTVKFSTDMDSLRSGSFSDSLDSYSNVVYVGGKGNNESKDVYEGEDENSNTNGLDRFESWDNRSSMTDESEYENEAKSMLSQYAQTVNVDGQGMIKCPYIFREQYNVGDIINLSFSGKSANVQILSVTEHWSWNNYETEFQFGKPIADLSRQIQLLLKKIRSAEIETKSSSTDSVKYYTIPTDTEMKKSEVTYGTIGFTGDIGDSNKLFKLYYESNGTGAKTYHVYFKQLSGSGKLILTSGVAGTEQLEFKSGTYVAIIYVDEDGNVKSTASISDTSTSTSSSWSSQKTQNELNAKANTSEIPNFSFNNVDGSTTAKYFHIATLLSVSNVDNIDGVEISGVSNYIKSFRYTIRTRGNYQIESWENDVIDIRLYIQNNGDVKVYIRDANAYNRVSGLVTCTSNAFKYTGTLPAETPTGTEITTGITKINHWYDKNANQKIESHSGSSTIWYYRIKPDNVNTNMMTLVTDSYGGTILVTGVPGNDSQLGANYKAVKANRLSSGNWSSDSPYTNNITGKITNVYLGSDGAVYVRIGSYTTIIANNLGAESVTFEYTTTLPSSYRELPIISNIGEPDDDAEMVDISSSCTKSLGVTQVLAYKKGRTVYINLSGTYSGTITTSTQTLVSNLPAKYRPTISAVQTFALMAYDGTHYNMASRGMITQAGEIQLGESSWYTNAYIRAGFTYIL